MPVLPLDWSIVIRQRHLVAVARLLEAIEEDSVEKFLATQFTSPN
jgi:hypothetical protein